MHQAPLVDWLWLACVLMCRAPPTGQRALHAAHGDHVSALPPPLPHADAPVSRHHMVRLTSPHGSEVSATGGLTGTLRGRVLDVLKVGPSRPLM